MFEKIKMVHVTPKIPLRNTNFLQESKKHKVELATEVVDALHSEFLISGSIDAVFPFPISNTIPGDFLCIQLFTLLDCDKFYYTRRENYKSYLLLYTYDGEGCLKYEGKEYTIEKGEGFLIDCQKPHYYYTKKDRWYHSDLHFYGARATYIYNEFRRNNIIKFSLSPNGTYQNQLENILYILTNVSNRRELKVSNLLESLLLSVLDASEQQNQSSMPDKIRYLIKYMESNYNNLLSLDELEQFSGMSKFHLSREFKKYTGFPPNEYLIEMRIHHAKILLESTSLPSYKIGILVGIPNENNFINLFKKRMGTTPGAYRENIHL